MNGRFQTAGRRDWRRWVGLAACWAIAIIFLRAGYPKVRFPHEFAESIYRYHLAHPDWINIQAVYMPWIEVVCGVALLVTPRLRKGALVLVVLMLLMFTAAIAIDVHRGINIDCGCFSVSHAGRRIGWLNLLRNAGFLALAALGWVYGTGRKDAFDDRLAQYQP